MPTGYFEMYDENENVIQQWFGGDSRKLIICLKR
jgi:hypothetical protein